MHIRLILENKFINVHVPVMTHVYLHLTICRFHEFGLVMDLRYFCPYSVFIYIYIIWGNILLKQLFRASERMYALQMLLRRCTLDAKVSETIHGKIRVDKHQHSFPLPSSCLHIR